MAPGQRLDPAARRQSLLDSAVALAAHGDLAAVSVQDIAAAAGVSEGLLYHYFPTKDALLLAAVKRAADAMTAALDAALDGAPGRTLLAALAAYLDHVQADPVGWRAMLAAHSGEVAAVADAVVAHSYRLLLTALGIAEPSPILQAAIEGWSALERAACLVWLQNPSLGRPELEDLLLSTFLAAVQAAGRADLSTATAIERLAAEMQDET